MPIEKEGINFMTKYEWESELKKGIHRLPDSEIKRVVEYYDELFYDKADRGKREADIIAEFGNPNDVAYKIIADYDGELKSESTVPPPIIKAEQAEVKPEPSQYNGYGDYSRYGDYSANHAERVAPVSVEPTASEFTASANQKVATAPVKKVKSNGGRVVALVLFSVFLGWAFFAVAAILWAVLVAMVAAGGAFVVVGAGGTVMSFIAMTSSVGAGFAQLGMYVALVGFGLIFIVLFVKLIKLSAKATASVFNSMKNFITVKKEGN